MLATLKLIEAALQDPAVSRLVLLSESCVPIHAFAEIQRTLFVTNKSHIEGCEGLMRRVNKTQLVSYMME